MYLISKKLISSVSYQYISRCERFLTLSSWYVDQYQILRLTTFEEI